MAHLPILVIRLAPSSNYQIGKIDIAAHQRVDDPDAQLIEATVIDAELSPCSPVSLSQEIIAQGIVRLACDASHRFSQKRPCSKAERHRESMSTRENKNSSVAFYNHIPDTKNPESALDEGLRRALSEADQAE